MLLEPKKIPFLQEITDPIFARQEIRFFIKREDVIHPQISGNKWHKLKYNLEEAKNRGHDTLLSFGGAYSNHIYALAAAARETGFASIGVIRGEQKTPLNPTLHFAVEAGMHLHYVTREKYRVKTDAAFIAGLICGLQGENTLIGFPVLKGDFLGVEVKKLVKEFTRQSYDNWHLMQQYHFGGYAKFTNELVHFINAFKRKHAIALDPVYTGKMM